MDTPYSLNILSFPLMILIHIFQCYLLSIACLLIYLILLVGPDLS